MAGGTKLYAYVDETGQDTGGSLFAVCVVVLHQDRESLRAQLEIVEQQSGKHRKKWHRARHNERQAYIHALQRQPELRHGAYFEVFGGQTKYIELTAFTTAKATLRHVKGNNYRVTVLVDGLKGSEVDVFRRGLRDLHIKTRKIRGVRRDENDAFIRLADAICGVVRDAREGSPWAVQAVLVLTQQGILTEL